jgi:hypothetical protein
LPHLVIPIPRNIEAVSSSTSPIPRTDLTFVDSATATSPAS